MSDCATDASDSGGLLDAFVAASDQIVLKTAAQHADFARRRRGGAPWTRIRRERGLELFQERVELLHGGATTLVSAFGGGELPGTLDAIMRGLYADSTDAMLANAPIQFGDVLDCGVVRAFRTRSDKDPHEFFGIKFVDRASRIPGVMDQFLWAERMGTKRGMSGEPFGFQLIKSVDGEERDRGDFTPRHIKMSVCYLYTQSTANTVDVFIRGIVELPVMQEVSETYRQREAVSTAAKYIFTAIRGREIERMSTITNLIQKSKTDREQLLACHCSKVVRGLSKIEMCSGCREAMRSPKLVSLDDADARKHGSAEPSEALEHLRLQTRLGSTRRDGELPIDEATKSYRESESFRMFLPIHDGRPETNYRMRRQQRDNVLLKMLRRSQRRQQSTVSASSGGSGETETSSTA